MAKAERTIRIAPSLLSADFTHLGDEVGRVEAGGADWLHVDVMDGHFVDNLTIGLPVVKALKRVAQRPLDVHIMISNPQQFARRYVECGAASLTFHLEAAGGGVREIASEIRAAGGQAGISINPDTPLERLVPYLDQADLVLIMSVFPGFGGQSFIPGVLDKVRGLRALGFDRDVEIDGGIGLETIGAAARAGANVFVAGTAIFKSVDPADTMKRMRAIAEAELRERTAAR
ncbi:MAG: ribulose-phosphate 3-epimerase [Planctomycetota bacterium]